MITKEQFDELKNLINEYGDAEFNSGDYNSPRNMLNAREAYKSLIKYLEGLTNN